MMHIENGKQSKRLWKTADKRKDMQKNVEGHIWASDMRTNFCGECEFFAYHGIVKWPIDRFIQLLLTFSKAKIDTGFAKRKLIYFRTKKT